MIIDVLIALLVVAAVGLIAGILLALASHFLRVEEDETVKNLRECLPGVNCGACGYTGCDEYAKAIAEGTAKTNLCIPGSDDVAERLSHIMGVKAEKPEDLVAFIKCNGNCNATTKTAVYDGIESCRAASMVYGGPDACKFGCIGCGDCAKLCPVGAITVSEGIARVDTSMCIGCSMCVRTCPKKIIELVEQNITTVNMCSNKEKGAAARKKCENACIGCKKCELNCPKGAIKVENNLAKIDYDKCDGCGICVGLCPTHCLKTVNLYQPCGNH